MTIVEAISIALGPAFRAVTIRSSQNMPPIAIQNGMTWNVPLARVMPSDVKYAAKNISSQTAMSCLKEYRQVTLVQNPNERRFSSAPSCHRRRCRQSIAQVGMTSVDTQQRAGEGVWYPSVLTANVIYESSVMVRSS